MPAALPLAVPTPTPSCQMLANMSLLRPDLHVVKGFSGLLTPGDDRPWAFYAPHIPKSGFTAMKGGWYCLLGCTAIACSPELTAAKIKRNPVGDYERCSRGHAVLKNFGHVPFMKRLTHKDYRTFSFVLLREPVARVISGYFYNGHNPNRNYYNAPIPAHLQRSDKTRQACFLEDQKEMKPFCPYTFDNYLAMPAFSNVVVQMLGLDRHPYEVDAAATEAHFLSALDRLLRFTLIGVSEARGATWLLLSRALGICEDDEARRVFMSTSNPSYTQFKNAKESIKKDAAMLARAAAANSFDVRLYQLAVRELCHKLEANGLLQHPTVQAELFSGGPAQC